MDFSLTPEQKELQSVARAFAQKEMTSVAKELEEKKEFLPDEWFDRYAEMGFLGINISKKYGGLGLPNLDALLVLEEFAKVSSVVAWPIFESAVGPIKAIEHFANEDLKQRIIPEVCMRIPEKLIIELHYWVNIQTRYLKNWDILKKKFQI